MENTKIKTIWKVVAKQPEELEKLLNEGWFLEKMTALDLSYGKNIVKGLFVVAVLSKSTENK